MYAWEKTASKKPKRASKSATLVFHNNENQSGEFDDFTTRLSEETTSAMREKLHFEGFLPVQSQSFVSIFKRRDVILHSRTGSGKTLAYTIPLMEREIAEGKASGKPFALIFTFSKELAVQTKSMIQAVYGKRVKVLIADLDEVTAETKLDVLVGTLSSIDHLVRGKAAKAPAETQEESSANEEEEDEEDVQPQGIVKVSNVSSIVIDEVDTTLGPKFSSDGRRMKNLLKHIRQANGSLSTALSTDFKGTQYVLCGATIPNWVLKVGFLGLRKYYFNLVPAGANKLPAQLECYLVGYGEGDRLQRVIETLQYFSKQRCLVFINNQEIHELQASLLTRFGKGQKKSRTIGSLSSEDENERIQNMKEFNEGTLNTLICTDRVARGLDFVDVDVVLMVSLPHHTMAVETVIHRAGRTARLEREGKCVIMYNEQSSSDVEIIRAIESRAHIQWKTLSGFRDEVAKKKFCTLRVRKAFSGKGQTSLKLPTPIEILQKNLTDEELSKIETIEESDPTTLSFYYPESSVHQMKQKLWKYDITIGDDPSSNSPKPVVGTKRKNR